MVLGIDEVGRGSWAGPLVVGAVVLGSVKIDGLDDSKKLTKKSREALDVIIRQKAKGFGVGWVQPEELDEIGLSEALKLATIRAVEQIKAPYNQIIIDGTVNFLKDTNKSDFVTTIKKADSLVPSVSAASIVAKVARDNYMKSQSKTYSQYSFSDNVGYGTKSHIESINKFGVTPLHRLSFKPLKKYKKNVLINSTSIGNKAEDVAARYLKKIGHKIIARNWKSKYCEIDIISKFDDRLYFNEVKYRSGQDRGGGLASINHKKLSQMEFAAKYYITSNNIDDCEMTLTAISLQGDPPVVTEFLEI